jgi:hypothetical protein
MSEERGDLAPLELALGRLFRPGIGAAFSRATARQQTSARHCDKGARAQ